MKEKESKSKTEDEPPKDLVKGGIIDMFHEPNPFKMLTPHEEVAVNSETHEKKVPPNFDSLTKPVAA